MKHRIEAILNLFPEVRWDRWSGTFERMTIFGWIARDDGKFDFVFLYLVNGQVDMIDTSSAKYSEEFGKRLGAGYDDHQPCKRVENFFNVNAIKLVH